MQKEIAKTITETVYFCDECGKEAKPVAICVLCGKELCKQCDNNQQNNQFVYREAFQMCWSFSLAKSVCPECVEIGKEEIQKQKVLAEKTLEKFNGLANIWMLKVKAKKNTTNQP